MSIEANPNSFTVYALNPPKNPFVQEERWYKDVLKNRCQAIRRLRDKKYFETDEPYIPNPDSLFANPRRSKKRHWTRNQCWAATPLKGRARTAS